jgi:hypothetical protein
MKEARPRKQSVLSPRLNNRLASYATAAGTAGVSLLALGTNAGAEIVYTPANITIGRGGSMNIDLNHDGVPDFVISEHLRRSSVGSSQSLMVRGKSAGNRINCYGIGCPYYIVASALYRGSLIGPNDGRGWDGEAAMIHAYIGKDGGIGYLGAWLDVKDRYLGLTLTINGEIHYGWARLNVRFLHGSPETRTWEAQLTGFAYETIARKPIPAGKTTGSDSDEGAKSSSKEFKERTQKGDLGSLAVGCSGIALWRRECISGDSV